MSIDQQLSAQVPASLAGSRLDQALVELFPDFSRSRLQKWVKSGAVLVDGEQLRSKDALLGGEEIELTAVLEGDDRWRAEAIPLDIVYQDDSIIVINKPAGLVVHPGAGNPSGTLANALLHLDPKLSSVPRAGVIHRLDKETSGLLVAARTLQAQKNLVEQLQARTFQREYLALCYGVMTAGGTVDAPIGRHPHNRLRMAVNLRSGKEAISHYRIEQRLRAHTFVRVQLETGRTHQIRVHMAHIQYPLVGDPVYGGRLRLPPQCTEPFAQGLRGFKRQALHATSLGLTHPASGENLLWTVPMPEDFAQLLSLARDDTMQHLASA